MRKRLGAALLTLVCGLSATAGFSSAASAATWPKGCKVTTALAGGYYSATSVCPSNSHRVVLNCVQQVYAGGPIRYYTKVGSTASPGTRSAAMCDGSSRIKSVELKVY